MARGRSIAGITALIAAIVVPIVTTYLCRPVPGRNWEGAHIRSAIDLGRYDDTTRGLITGYNYYLLQQFAKENGATIEILHSYRGETACVDSLRNGTLDLVAIPYADSTVVDSVLVSDPVGSISLWLVPGDDDERVKVINDWLRESSQKEEFQEARKKFMDIYDPLRRAGTGKKYDYISPYDSLIRMYADTLGWDWRMLAAVIYQESKFRIGVRSRKGASGIMQMMPSTAGKLAAEDIFNPETGIKCGAVYLKSLSDRYASVAADPAEQQKLALAAYNAGVGRIKDCINFATLNGSFSGRWDELVAVLPQMADESILDVDTVKLGVFKGVETVAYVDRVLSLYEAFCRICPSWNAHKRQDPHEK